MELMLLLSSSRSVAFARMLNDFLANVDCVSFDDLMARFEGHLSPLFKESLEDKRSLLQVLSSPEGNSALWRQLDPKVMSKLAIDKNEDGSS